MTRPTVAILGCLITLTLRALGVPQTQPSQTKCTPATFSTLLPSEASLEAVAAVPSDGSYGEGAANVAYPVDPTGLPALCAVTVNITSSPRSSYRFGLFLPEDAVWSQRFLAVGNGGFAGGINWIDMAPGTHFGHATLSTDTGHNSTSGDLTWAFQNPETRTDWGWRAVHGSVELGKKLTAAYYGRDISRSYYSGCSTGGRQGLKEVQMFPETFDGVLAGAPAWYSTHLNPWVTKLATYNLPYDDPKHIPYTLFPAIATEVVKQCDGVDGNADGIVSEPEQCAFDFSKIQCGNPGADPTACLTEAQVQTAKNIYSDYRFAEDESGEYIYSGFSFSSELQWYVFLGGTAPSEFSLGWERYFLYDDPAWTWAQYSDAVVRDAEREDPGNATAAAYDISAFRDRGGKLIIYHGLADGVVPTRGSTYYYDRTIEALGGDADGARDFFRYFQVPGMQHCFGTVVDAPWDIGAALQAAMLGSGEWSVPGFVDAKHDALLALQGWVENNTAVDSIVATTWRSPLLPATGVLRQRPICPYPEKAVFDGIGDINSATSWTCR